MDSLRELLRRAQGARLSRSERQALDIFVVAFVTMSRVGEVAALQADEVAKDGGTITLRPKTKARTWERFTKKVSSTKDLRATEILRQYRERARTRGKTCLFRGKSGKPPETATITRHLKSVTRKLGVDIRVTSHGARKGAAVEAVLAGIPLPVVQAIGGWSDINTMQAYIGEALRRAVPWLEAARKVKGEGKRGMSSRQGKWN